jgi:PIN domain nuclease of toxin-antitoxin system
VIILDTHAWIWWAAEPARLSKRARGAIDGATQVGVCAVSCWEVAMLVARGRLVLDRDPLAWVEQALALPRAALIPLEPAIAVAAAQLDASFPGDPADRMIAASALHHRAALVSKDARLHDRPGLRCIW